jgi:large subunit ribosomal protein L30
MAKLRITWKRSCIGRPDKQERTIRAFGFRKLNDTVEMEDTPQIRGMIAAVHHLVDWEAIEK